MKHACLGLSARILRVLSQKPRELAELKGELKADEGALRTVLNRLERLGYVEHDGIADLWLITEKGRRVLQGCAEQRRKQHVKVRQTEVREVTGRKRHKGKVYEYTYYTLPLNIYIPKHVVEQYGREYVVIFDDETGEIRALPKALYEQMRRRS